MNSRVLRIALAVLVSSALPQTANAEGTQALVPARELSEAEVVALTFHHNLSLAGAVISEKQAETTVHAEEARYPLTLQANAGFTRTASPSLGPDGTVVTGARDSVAFGSTLTKNFPMGTSVALSVQGDRTVTTRAVGALITNGSAGTGYSLSTRLTVAQPLLRGAGTGIGESELRVARLNVAAQRESLGRVTSEVLRDALSGYWELWYASDAVGIELATLKLAEAELRDAAARADSGALATVDLLSFETRLSSQGEQVTAAELLELQRGITLAQVLGVDASGVHLRAVGDPRDPTTPTVAEVETKLAKQSPEILELLAKLEVAESRAKVAGDVYRPKLDLQGYVELKGLGNGGAIPALVQVGSLGAVGGYVGVLFEAPLTGGREAVELESARLAVRTAQNQLDAARLRLRASAVQLVSQLDAAKVRRAAAEQTEAISTKLFEAERARFALGASTPLQMQTAEDVIRQARLRVARARVDAVLAWILIEHATGELLSRYGTPTAETLGER